ncbi:hypothetical protein [Flavobacterium beibuense]|uniref:Uncharacterized protein n=1 Tax=Flavobacterium beibuense TaxID=657326 RepID=A0A444WGS8_9FLAO|nr:hypothetical protein [Flavobacterium beibuense]RYJ44946.1 hypothetical protein NU09_0580 [Flavobacterium beibuense]
MTKREQYQLEFLKVLNNNRVDYECYHTGQNPDFNRLAFKLYIMDKLECEGLIDEINNAENGEYYEHFFSLDNAAASDEDGIEIVPPNIIIDNQLIISFSDMKQLLDEWLDFRNS